MIIDCHVHISQYGPENEGQPFERVRDNLLAAMRRNGIALAFVYADSEPNTGVSDMDATPGLVADHPELLMLGSAHVPGLDAAAIARLDRLADDGGIIGIKLYPGFEEFYPDEERCHAIYEVCVKHDMPVAFHSGETMDEPWREVYNHPREIAKVAERFPALKISIAHFSQPHLDACREAVLAYPNVHVDISGLAHPSVIEACGQEAIVRNLEAVAARQPHKVLFGTDWPMCDVDAHLQLVLSLSIPDAAKDLILAGNAERIFKLGEEGRM